MGNRKLPFGYRMEDGKIVFHPQEAEIAKTIFRDYISGMGFAGLAEKLNGQNVRYASGKAWNKNMLARILADVRYVGEKGFPAIISKGTLTAAAAVRSEKSTPLTVIPAQKSLRRLCGVKPTAGVENRILRMLNAVIKNPDLIRCPAQEKKDASVSASLEAQLDRLLAEQPVGETAAMPLILRLAAARYEEIGDGEYETERLRDIFSQAIPMAALDAELLTETVSSVSTQHGGQIKITLKNGQSIEGEISHD